MQDIAPKHVESSKITYQNPWISVHEDTTVTLDGQKGLYAYLESKDSVMVVTQNDQNEIYLVRGFRYPSKSFGWELPGGGGDGENLLDASKRELEEETGIIADSWETLGSAYVCNGLMTEKMTVCLATNLHFSGHKQESDETFEAMQFFTMDQIENLILEGQINDCQTLAGLQYYGIWKKRKENA